MHVSFDILTRAFAWLALQASPAAATVPLDTLSVAVEDTLSVPAVTEPLVTMAADSLTAATDSLFAVIDSNLVGLAEAEPVAVLPPPWIDDARLGPERFAEDRSGLLADAIVSLPQASLRVGGDWGAPAYLSLGPIGGPAPEILYDGIPSRSPADLDPSVWDRSVIPLASLDIAGGHTPPGGEPALVAETALALPGRTHLRSHFTKEDFESFLRGLWITTPQAQRTIRLEFEEWKTEEGFNFTLNPQFDTLPGAFGRSKMRRFRTTAEAATPLGRLALNFGRGRRLYRGTVLQVGDTERWTGEVSVGLDRGNDEGHWRVRAYHLDFTEDDGTHAEKRSAARLGLRLSHVPRDRGWGTSFTLERWSASFVSGAERRVPSPAYVGRAAASLRTGLGADFVATLSAEGAHATHASQHVDAAGRAGLERLLGPSASLAVFAARRLRTPTLLETDGFLTADYADGSTLRREGAGPLAFERQDQLALTLRAGRERWELSGTGEVWRLTDGIGFERDGIGAATVGGLELTVRQIRGEARLEGGGSLWGWRLRAHGHHVLGPLERVRDRGAGWPLWEAQGHARLSRQVANRHNRAFIEVRVHALGARFDDSLAALNGTRLPSQTQVDGRAGLKVRDAELYLAWRNLTDVEWIEVSGTRRRPREFRFGIHWPFYN